MPESGVPEKYPKLLRSKRPEARGRRVATFWGNKGVYLSWLERVPDKDEVLGSNPSTPTILKPCEGFTGLRIGTAEKVPRVD